MAIIINTQDALVIIANATLNAKAAIESIARLESKPSLVRLHLGVAKSSLIQAENELNKAFAEMQKQESTSGPADGKQTENPSTNIRSPLNGISTIRKTTSGATVG
jgi:hypothetical protein